MLQSYHIKNNIVIIQHKQGHNNDKPYQCLYKNKNIQRATQERSNLHKVPITAGGPHSRRWRSRPHVFVVFQLVFHSKDLLLKDGVSSGGGGGVRGGGLILSCSMKQNKMPFFFCLRTNVCTFLSPYHLLYISLSDSSPAHQEREREGWSERKQTSMSRPSSPVQCFSPHTWSWNTCQGSA